MRDPDTDALAELFGKARKELAYGVAPIVCLDTLTANVAAQFKREAYWFDAQRFVRLAGMEAPP